MTTTYKDMHKYSNLNYPSLMHVPNAPNNIYNDMHNPTIDVYNIILAWNDAQISHATKEYIRHTCQQHPISLVAFIILVSTYTLATMYNFSP